MIEGVELTRSSDQTAQAFQRHLNDLIARHGGVFLVDLLSDTKAREVILTKEYIYQLHQCPDEIKENVMFHHFDFHAFCSGDNYH